MTNAHIPPEDAFDQWLDDLADGSRHEADDPHRETAAQLHRLLGVAPATGPRLSKRRKLAIRQRILPNRAASPTPLRSSGATGMVANPAGAMPLDSPWSFGHVASMVSAALLIVLAIASVGLALRFNDSDNLSGVSATASIMSFAPASALASPAPLADCTTDDTLLLMPESEPDPETLADLPFPVAWYRHGLLTVENRGEMLREIEIGAVQHLQPTRWPGVAIAYASFPEQKATLINLASGAVFEMDPFYVPQWTDGPFMFWSQDESDTHWGMIDLRTFEHVDLTERFEVNAPQGWVPVVQMGNSSDDGTVLVVSVNPIQSADRQPPMLASPTLSDLPSVEIIEDALVINGHIDDISVVGPLASSSGAMALSPDGTLMAWLAPAERAGTRTLTIADTATGEGVQTQPVEATWNNSLLFNSDGSILYATTGTTLEQIAVRPDGGTPVATAAPITVPDTAYRIIAASPERDRLLLARSDVDGDTLLWVDVESGETREFDGLVGQVHESWIPNYASRIASHVVILDRFADGPYPPGTLLDMDTSEMIDPVDNSDILGTGVAMISEDGSTALNAPGDRVEFIDLTTGMATDYPAPEEVMGNATSFTITPDGACAVVTWPTDGDRSITRLYSAVFGDVSELPASPAEGWAPGSDDS